MQFDTCHSVRLRNWKNKLNIYIVAVHLFLNRANKKEKFIQIL